MIRKSCLFLWVEVLLAMAGCHTQPKAETTPNLALEIPEDEPFRDGDLVLRCGSGMESRAVTMQSGSDYSHIGILQFDSAQGVWMVIHAVPKEAPEGEPEYLKCEPIAEFYAPKRAVRGAWMRVNCADSIAQKAAEYCYCKYADRVVFDNYYLLEDTTELYCCELVWRAYLQQGIDITSRNRHFVPVVFSAEEGCIFPCDIENGLKTEFVKPFKIKHL